MGATVMDLVDRLRAALADRYELDREIGHGGMAYVYRAHDRQHDRDVAIKVLRPELAAALGTERFLREIRIEARLQHPHILPLFDSGVAAGFLYYVMPYVEGETLRDRIRRENQLSLPDALQIAREVAEALSYAHSHDVLHRDIKPENILLNGEHAMVADFGIAKALSHMDQEELTGTGIAIGTPEYMSPEQGTGDGTADRRSDIYALGCVLYEMLAGDPPFSGRTAQSVLARHRQDPPPPLHVVRPGISPELEATVERALAKVPADRFPTAEAFAASLVAGSGTGERSHPRKDLRGILSAGAVVTILGALGLAAILHRSPGVPPSSPIGVVVLPFDGSDDQRAPHGGPAPAGHVLLAEALDWVPGLRAIDGGALLGPGRGSRSVPFSELLSGAARLGGRYVVTGAVLPAGAGSRVSLDVYSVSDGERVVRVADSTPGPQLDVPVGRLAVQLIGALADRENLDLGARRAAFSSTSSAAALGHLLQGQARFSAGDYDGAATAYQQAIEADSSCGLAYLRLSDVDGWRYDYSASLSTLDAGLRTHPPLPPRWTNLLQARRQFVLGNGEQAIAAFQNAVLDDRDDIDAWVGLGESLFHLAAYAGHSPADALPALERTAELDSSFAPIYDHLVDLALSAGDSARAARYVRRMGRDDPARSVREAAILQRFGGTEARRTAQNQLRGADRQALSQIIALWAHGSVNLPLADTLAGYLTGSHRTPDDRRRGAEFRMAVLAAQGSWPDAVAAWRADAGDHPFDGWMVHAYLAGYPAAEIVNPMFAWARSQVASGLIPDFTRPAWDELEQGFQALVHRATLMGDSTEVLDLLARMKRARPSIDQSDPAPASLQFSLEARLSLLRGDSVGAIDLLQRSLSRINEPFVWYYPLTSMAPQRLLLGELLQARGLAADARRWRESFRTSWSIGDVLFAARLAPSVFPAGP
ncbi:MAG: protein kinase domain-containing protein [Gemmatimonadales bacterium]